MRSADRNSVANQLALVRRRTRETVRELTETMNALAADEFAGTGSHDDECDLHTYCICLEVALDEARKWAQKLEERVRAASSGPQWPIESVLIPGTLPHIGLVT